MLSFYQRLTRPLTLSQLNALNTIPYLLTLLLALTELLYPELISTPSEFIQIWIILGMAVFFAIGNLKRGQEDEYSKALFQRANALRGNFYELTLLVCFMALPLSLPLETFQWIPVFGFLIANLIRNLVIELYCRFGF